MIVNILLTVTCTHKHNCWRYSVRQDLVHKGIRTSATWSMCGQAWEATCEPVRGKEGGVEVEMPDSGIRGPKKFRQIIKSGAPEKHD